MSKSLDVFVCLCEKVMSFPQRFVKRDDVVSQNDVGFCRTTNLFILYC